MLRSFPHENEVPCHLGRVKPLCMQPISYASIHDQKSCYNTSKSQEDTAIDTVGHHSVLCIHHPAGLKHTIRSSGHGLL